MHDVILRPLISRSTPPLRRAPLIVPQDQWRASLNTLFAPARFPDTAFVNRSLRVPLSIQACVDMLDFHAGRTDTPHQAFARRLHDECLCWLRAGFSQFNSI